MMHDGEKLQQKSTTKAVKKLEKNILVSRTSMEQVSAFAENRGSQPVCRDPVGVERPFQGDHLRPSNNTGVYITVHNSSKRTVTK